MKKRYTAIMQALAAALLFGLSAPASKLLLGSIEPLPLAAFLYLGSGFGLLMLKGVQSLKKQSTVSEAGIKREDIKWLGGALLAGGVAAPVILMFSLKATPAATASLLLNFESVATALLAGLIFKEAVGKRVWIAVAFITAACILLSWDMGGSFGISLGAAGIVAACALWGLDNNLTRNISAKDPVAIVMVKGLGAGTVSLILALAAGSKLPDIITILEAMGLGFVLYGLSIVLFILAMRSLGSARTSAFFGVAPFAGAALSLLLFPDNVNIMFFISIPIMAAGAILLLKERHGHMHLHEHVLHEHRHSHTDGHHNHTHEGQEAALMHSHVHEHETLQHTHAHAPDIHHRHGHKEN